jgi:mannose-6-phosphate isomerase-like protein (cupin superfamily)
MDKVDLADRFSIINRHWSPEVVAALNGQQVKLAKFLGAFPWHAHSRKDELFLVFRGRIRIELRDGIIELGPGELFVVPAGVEHRSMADEESEVLMFEPASTVMAGD